MAPSYLQRRLAAAPRVDVKPHRVVTLTEQLHAWFEAEPWHTGRQLLERLQAAHPGEYPDGLLRTVQRRVKVWAEGESDGDGVRRTGRRTERNANRGIDRGSGDIGSLKTRYPRFERNEL